MGRRILSLLLPAVALIAVAIVVVILPGMRDGAGHDGYYDPNIFGPQCDLPPGAKGWVHDEDRGWIPLYYPTPGVVPATDDAPMVDPYHAGPDTRE